MTLRKNSLGLMELSSINKVSLVQVSCFTVNTKQDQYEITLTGPPEQFKTDRRIQYKSVNCQFTGTSKVSLV